jgi:hypothetical protein
MTILSEGQQGDGGLISNDQRRNSSGVAPSSGNILRSSGSGGGQGLVSGGGAGGTLLDNWSASSQPQGVHATLSSLEERVAKLERAIRSPGGGNVFLVEKVNGVYVRASDSHFGTDHTTVASQAELDALNAGLRQTRPRR